MASVLVPVPVLAAPPLPPYRWLRLGQRGRLILCALTVLGAWMAAVAFMSERQRQQAAHSAGVRAEVAQLFETQLGVDQICHLGPVPFAADALLTATETQLRRLAPPTQTLPLACGLSTLARSHALIGHYATAERLAEEANALLRERSADNLSVTATSVSLLNLQAKYAQAEKIAMSRLRHPPGRMDPATRLDQLRLQIELARAQWGQADDDGALNSLESALTQARKLVPPEAALIAELLTQRGEWRGRRFDFRGAERDLTQAIAMSQGTTQADNARYNLVRMLTYSEQPEYAVNQAELLIADRRAHIGEQHPDTGRAWTALADALFNSGRFDDSARALRNGKAIVLASFGERHPEYAEVLRLESLEDYARGRYGSSVDKARRAVDIYMRAFGPTHEQTLRARFNLATKLTFGPGEVWDTPSYHEGVGMLEDLIQTGSEADIPTPHEKMSLAVALTLRAPERELPRAERLLREVRDDAHRYLPPRAMARFIIDYTLAVALNRSGQQAQADAMLANLLADLNDGNPLGLPLRSMIHDTLILRALYAMSTCRKRDAMVALREAVDNDRKYLPSETPRLRIAQDFMDEIAGHGALRESFVRQLLQAGLVDQVNAAMYSQAATRSRDCTQAASGGQ